MAMQMSSQLHVWWMTLVLLLVSNPVQAQEGPRTVSEAVMAFFNGCLLHLTGEPFEAIAKNWNLTPVKKEDVSSLSFDKAAWTIPTTEGHVLFVQPDAANACSVRVVGVDATQARQTLEAAIVKKNDKGVPLFELYNQETRDFVIGHFYESSQAPEGVSLRAHITFKKGAPKDSEDVMLQTFVVASEEKAEAIAPRDE